MTPVQDLLGNRQFIPLTTTNAAFTSVEIFYADTVSSHFHDLNNPRHPLIEMP
jgi:hypothetical protein